MLRRNREINIFSMSALDLFASALGAFILLTLILLPYYLKTGNDQTRQFKAQQQKIQQLEKQLKDSTSFALLGISTKARSFTILIDMSGSMQQYTDIMLQTIHRILTPMKKHHKIQLIGYQGEGQPLLHAWKKPHRLTPMTAPNKQAALSWVDQLNQHFSGRTPTHAALLEALKYKSEAIILLTDGAPNRPPDQIIEDITRRNQAGKQIHTIALGNYRANPALVDFLQQLAKANHGGFLGVSN